MTLAGTELVLGMDWLASLGDIKANFQDMFIKWEGGGQKFKIRGERSLSKQQVSLKSMRKALLSEEERYLLQYWEMQSEGAELQLLPEVKEVLEAFSDVFQAPTGLPPAREQDHAIVLKPGAPAPNIRPYRYPHYQKDEIEKFVNEMLFADIIRP